MKSTIFLKTVAGFIIISLILVLSILLISHRLIRSYHLESVRDYLDDISYSISEPVSNYVINNEYEQLEKYIQNVSNKVNYRITVIKRNGEVVADSDENITLMDDHSGRKEVVDALQEKVGESIRYSTTIESDMLYRAIPLFGKQGDLIAVLRVSIYLDRIDTLINSLKARIYLISIIVLLISLCIIYLYVYRLTRPIKELTTAVNKMSQGDFDVNIISRNNDDIGYLIRAFNDMAFRINKLVDQLTYQKNSLHTIITSMKEGLFLIDKNHKIIEANKSFKSIIKEKEVINKIYWEVIQSPELSHYISEIINTQQNLSKEIIINNIHYLCSGLVTIEEEVLILLHDISELKKIERIKKDIVANVSHEIRSPLTSIKGFIETLEGEVTPTGKEYLTIIQRNIGRLINIVNDLLTLSRLERGDNLELKPIQITPIMNNVIKIFRRKMATKPVSLKLISNDNLPDVMADSFKIEQLLTNLLDNASEYTEQGEIVVEVKNNDPYVSIIVSDTGCGMPSKELEKIFERFYVVDKSRSRKYGGTGLGLSIVKHIALLHNGHVYVKSTLGEGSVFTINLPATI